MKRPHVGPSLLATILLLLAAACTSGDGSGERDTDPDSALRGGTLRVGVPDDDAVAFDLDPANYLSQTWALSRCCLSRTLYSYNGSPRRRAAQRCGRTWPRACRRSRATA
jgi:hypothetical protein